MTAVFEQPHVGRVNGDWVDSRAGFQAGVSEDLGEVPLSPLPGIPGAKVLITGCALC